MFQSIRTYRRTGDDFSATAPCTYVRFTFLKRRYMKNSDRQSLYFSGTKSSQVKSVNYLPDGRNGFTESRFSEQQSEYVEAWRITRFRVKSHRTEKSIGATCEQDIIPAILSGFDDNRIFHDTAKRMRRMAC